MLPTDVTNNCNNTHFGRRAEALKFHSTVRTHAGQPLCRIRLDDVMPSAFVRSVSLHSVAASGQDVARHVLQMHAEVLKEAVTVADGPERSRADVWHFDTQGTQCVQETNIGLGYDDVCNTTYD